MARKTKAAARPGLARRVNLADVARAAAVSTSAVSRTFTEGASVSQKTRERVLTAADALGYRPNALARAMITQKSRLIAVIMTNYRSPYFPHLLKALNRELDKRGFSMLLLLTAGRETADEAVERARDYSADGIILVAVAPSQDVAAAAEAEGIPLVVLDRDQGAPTSARVWIDGPTIGRQTAERFLAEGRRHPIAVSHSRAAAQPTEIAAFIKRMNDAGVAVGHVKLGIDYPDGLEAGPLLFDRAPKPDAIFATASMLACGIYDAATKDYGMRVPQDLSIVAVGNAPQLNWRSYPISAANLPVDTLALEAVEILAERIAKPEIAPARRLVPCEFIWRESTLSVRREDVPAEATPGR